MFNQCLRKPLKIAGARFSGRILFLMQYPSTKGNFLMLDVLKLLSYVGRKTTQAVLCISSTIASMCPNRLKYLNLLRDMTSFFCSAADQQGSLKSLRMI